MSGKLKDVLLVIIVAEAIVWGLISYNALIKARLELSSLRTETGTLEMNLEVADNALAKTEEDLISTRQELGSSELTISSLESRLELYEDTWGLNASGVQPPFQGADIVSNQTATNPDVGTVVGLPAKG